MFPLNLSELPIPELLAAHSEVLGELQKRGVLRSKNNPTGDYTEWLVSIKLKLTLETNSSKGFDAKDSQGLRYQIKGRRVTPKNKSTQLGVIRNLEEKDFDFLVAVVYDEHWKIQAAAKIPHQRVPLLATFRPHQNGHIMSLRPSIFNDPDVEDISSLLST